MSLFFYPLSKKELEMMQLRYCVEIRGQVYTSNKMPCLNTFIKKINLEFPLRHALSAFSRIDLSEV